MAPSTESAGPTMAPSTESAGPTMAPSNGTEILPLALDHVGWRPIPDGPALLDDVCARIEAGPRTVVLGPNGSGKTLTLRICHGLLAPTGGCVRWLGPDGARAAGRHAMVFQRPVLLRRSVAANVAYALRLQRLPAETRRARCERALADAGLAGLARRPARRLSVGEQQRVALARAWATRPRVLFLDEPTASLDPGATRAVETTVRAIAESGTKIVMTTHDLAQARRIADEVLFIHRGRLVEHTPAEEFFEEPRSREARAFLKGELFW
jgi:tungstate transport system ATP-binding protein